MTDKHLAELAARQSDFPVVWERPEDALICWRPDPSHFPDPMAALEFAVMSEVMAGMTWASEQFGRPVRAQARLFNHRWFSAMGPIDGSPEQIGAMMETGDANVAAAMRRVDTLWPDEWLPEIERHLAFWEAFDLTSADLPALLEHFDETLVRFKRLWQLHSLIVQPCYLAMSVFEDLCRDLFGDTSALGPFRLTQGLGNRTHESGRALWQLSQHALAEPDVRRVLMEQGAEEISASLEATSAGRVFLGELRAYLAQWGKRGELMGIRHPSWIEDPSPAIKQIAANLAQPARNVDAEFARLVAEREDAETEARAKLAGYPAAVRQEFESMLRIARVATVASQDHNDLIDFQGCYHVRRVLLEIGSRLTAAGALAASQDVIYLSSDELRATVTSQPAIDQRAIVAERKASIARAQIVVPPPRLGAPPAGPPPGGPLGKMGAKMFGTPPPAATAPNELRGHAGSPGRVRGTARILRSLADADKLRPGDVLVAESTAPPWTPLFASVAAVVTDTGGVLSHCAVIAREYGIPAVVGVGRATAVLRDGQPIEVDGDTGTIRMLDR